MEDRASRVAVGSLAKDRGVLKSYAKVDAGSAKELGAHLDTSRKATGLLGRAHIVGGGIAVTKSGSNIGAGVP